MEQEHRIFRQVEEDEVLLRLRRDPWAYRRYLNLEEHWRERFMEFCKGRKTLPLLYDTFFKRMFHPDIHPERLSDCISCLLKETVKIKGILPQEDVLIDGDALMVMDILVELTDGSLVLVEIQKVPYLFPAERADCYSADLLLRQYSRVKGDRGKHFTYRDLKKVYTIIFYENSTEEFHAYPDVWVHHSRTQSDSGLRLHHLQEFYFIALDVFRKSSYAKGRHKDDRLAGWLSLLCTEDANEAEELCRIYPWLEEIYREMAAYSNNPEEVLGMFSEALREMDRNTVKYMIEQQQKVIEDQAAKLEEKDLLLSEKDSMISEKNSMITEKDLLLSRKDLEIERLKRLLGDNNMLHEEM
ncbi:MAG: PD-(D/E)XK nuclease family transposase [Lachnospiraceae bacterium]|nr:PD-(D/E)XK nuclease family transposase [Lachnospiraceae bacterium]